jgi:two-component system phosphate regulon sensor histidine kinase PhoR
VVGITLIAAALVAVALVLALQLRSLRAERAEAASLLGARDEPLAVAIARELRQRVPREELSATLFSREAVLEAAPSPVIVFDSAGLVRRANGAARATIPACVEGAHASAIAGALGEAVDEVLLGPPQLEREIVLDDPVRRTFHAHLRSHPAGSSRGAVAVLVDVTSTVDFREARRLFSAAVSHELRTPLARILGLVETLSLPQSESDREELIVQTEREIDNMRRLVDEMLLLAALDRGDLVTSPESSDAGAIAQAVITDRSARRAGREAELSIDAVRGLHVAVPGRLLEVVVGNIVDNALRHGGIGAAVSVAVRGRAGEVEVVVTDDGVGIAPEHLPHVFERFYRGEASRAGPGTGLGLAVVKHIAETYGGRVSADSTPGAGTTVRLVLPEAGAGP